MKKIHLLSTIFAICTLLCVTSCLSAQSFEYTTQNKKAIARYEASQNAYDKRNMSDAEKLLLEAIKLDEHFIEAHLLLSQVYQVVQRIDEAIGMAERAIELNPSFFPHAHYNVANMLLSQGEYQRASVYYNSFLNYPNIREETLQLARLRLKSCAFALEALANPVPFVPVSLGSNVNTIYDDYWPSLSADENTLVITSNIPKDPSLEQVIGNRQEDFFITTRDEKGNWKPVKNIGTPINTPYFNEGAQSITADGKTMYYTVCEGRCNIFVSSLQDDGQWGRPRKLPEPVNLGYSSEKQPSISPDGTTLYFVSDRKGGLGGYDIWRAKRIDEHRWEQPENLGETINTPFLEQSPFIHFDNQTLYFSSNGHVGMGGLDIFMTQMIDDTTWTTPVNLGYPINTHKNEDGLIVNAMGNTAYFSSEINPDTRRDIYTFEMPLESRPISSSYITGSITDERSGWPLQAEFSLIDVDQNQTIMESVSSQDGDFFLCVPTNRRYAFFASTPGYLFYSEHFDLKGEYSATDPYVKNIELSPILVNQTMVMRNVFFDTDSYELLSESLVELQKLYELLRVNPTLEISVEGHTDNVGEESYNQVLSENRAKAVTIFLEQKGIVSKRIAFKGFGESRPVESNDTHEGRARNRRTEIRVIKL